MRDETKVTLRVIRDEDLHDSTKQSIVDFDAVYSGTLDQVNKHCKKRGLRFVSERNNMFGGYYVGEDGSTSYLLT